SIAKNYLNTEELEGLNRIVSMYLDYAEDQAKRRRIMYMSDWVEKLNAFLQFNEREILQDNGKVTHEIAKAFAENEFEKFRVIQDRTYKSDFDKLIETAQKLEIE
ncbi:MAG: virulence RhuM family protein, partial [Prevotellaceae bacterium]|nr:virulence RhuM family protein [Prevotellaceae bacterium]